VEFKTTNQQINQSINQSIPVRSSQPTVNITNTP